MDLDSIMVWSINKVLLLKEAGDSGKETGGWTSRAGCLEHAEPGRMLH